MTDTLFKNKTVLLLEDNLDLLQIFEDQLTYLGFRVLPCSDFIQAKAHLLKEKVDAFITDWNVSGYSVDTLLFDQEYKKLLPAAIIILTAFSQSPEFNLDLQKQFVVLDKPFYMESLLDNLTKLFS